MLLPYPTPVQSIVVMTTDPRCWSDCSLVRVVHVESNETFNFTELISRKFLYYHLFIGHCAMKTFT